MKYHSDRDRDVRYSWMEIKHYNQCFEARVNLTFPSPSYKYELTDKELNKITTRLQYEFSEIYTKVINEALRVK